MRLHLPRRATADHWSFLFGQIAVYCFAVLLVTGAFLTFFYTPDMTQAPYQGSYEPLRGVPVSRAYESTMDLSLDTRGGLLVRQIHHWAALLLPAAIACQLLRMFFTGAFRRPRAVGWLVWVALFVLAMVAGVTGGLLPDDMLSGGTLGLVQSITLAIPFVGTDLAHLVFGGDFPGDAAIPGAYWLHITLIPVVMGGLFLLRGRMVRRNGHTRFRPAPEVPARAASAALFLFVAGVLSMLGTVAQINPIWNYGPYRPGDTTAGAVPDWYMGFLDGAIRIMPNWEPSVAGHPLTLAVLVPALLIPGAFFTVLAAYPWVERRLTGDDRVHDLLDRPRDAAVRTGVGAAGATFYGLLWAASANDQIAVEFHLSLFTVTWFFRVAVLVGPLLAYAVTHRLCLALTRREREEAAHGRETGRIVMSPTGGFTEIHEPVQRELASH
ncbi:cytochrome bc1 complex cytochrome b subunit [Actinomadura hibisca]|uniref:cytochrome bc1 complex cytochrome b subunit n=1 Tax=Actinomadura hibisca TaxID=68565 RepID=UPI0008334FA3|nr:cytochrome b N-terminal domain-containing protein [Actinomadura hibisca]